MNYLSVCSGVEAASLAWEPLGWHPQAFSEVAPFPSAVLAERWPNVPNMGDMTQIDAEDYLARYGRPDVIVGGTPCQSFSVSGLRGGLDDARGNLTLAFLRLARALRPRWLVWENVPGVLHHDHGRTFGAILGAMGQLGFQWAYRVLDAQYFRVAQRRRRVFVIGHLGGTGNRAAAVLFERSSLRGDLAPRRKEGARVASTITSGASRLDDNEVGRLVVFDPTQITHHENRSNPQPGGPCHTLPAAGHAPMAVWMPADVADPITANEGRTYTHEGKHNFRLHNVVGARPRRLTPEECERLQGMPEGHTRIPWRGKPASDCPDGHRYRAIGNSMAVPVMRWLGERIALVDSALA